MSPAIDTRPIAFIQLYNGIEDIECCEDESYQKTECWWRCDSAIDNLLEIIDNWYYAGFRRFVLDKPIGLSNNGMTPSSTWFDLSDSKKENITNSLLNYVKSKEDFRLGIYSGYKIYKSNSSDMDETKTRNLTISNKNNSSWFKDNYNNWINSGISFLAFESSSGVSSYSDFLKLSSSLWLKGIASIGEPLPLIESEGKAYINNSLINKSPWMFYESFIYDNDINNISYTDWKVDSDSECHIVFEGKDGQKSALIGGTGESYIDNWVQRGFIPSVILKREPQWFVSYIANKYRNGDGRHGLDSSNDIFVFSEGQRTLEPEIAIPTISIDLGPISSNNVEDIVSVIKLPSTA